MHETSAPFCPAGSGSADLPEPWFEHLAALIPILDLRRESAATEPRFCPSDKQESAIVEIARSLYRSRQRHALISGPPGVGKSTTLFKLADRIRSGQFPFLAKHRLLYVDVQNVGEEDSRSCLETLFTALRSCGPTVLFVDGIASLFKSSQGRNNRPILRALLSRPTLSLAGTLTAWDYAEHVANDAQMIRTFQRIELDEPEDEALQQIVARSAAHYSALHGLRLDPAAARRVISLAATFVLSEHQPAKSVDVIRRACEDRSFAQTHLCCSQAEVNQQDFVRVISERTGIPADTIAGQAKPFDFRSALQDAVVGQEEAVSQVATEMELIAAGLGEKSKPASVMMFAGTTGVGKTELAKRIAKLYSGSGRVKVYPMGNFTEAHSVSTLIGVPPGYVGHEEGGQLINDLLADPYSVFLLDEAEKCHPNIWKPFLNLFDEGWIVDKRGRKAYADRAIFILTTNAGDRSISQLVKSGKSPEEIAEQVRKSLSRVRQERSSQPVFPPQFLSRMRRIIVFNPLSQDALITIAERATKSICARWKQVREKELVVSEDLVRRIGLKGHSTNELVNGEEGGRVIGKLAREVIEHRILTRAAAEPDRYRQCERIFVSLKETRSEELAADVVFE